MERLSGRGLGRRWTERYMRVSHCRWGGRGTNGQREGAGETYMGGTHTATEGTHTHGNLALNASALRELGVWQGKLTGHRGLWHSVVVPREGHGLGWVGA